VPFCPPWWSLQNNRVHKKSWECVKANKGCVSHCGLAIYIKNYSKANKELWKFKYFTMQKKYYLQKKNPLKETKTLQDIIITLL